MKEGINMKKFAVKTLKLFSGFFVLAVGIVMTINAELGLAPWEIFHQGITKVFGITMGQASVTVGGIIVIADCIFGERIGIGTVLNIIFIGMFIDVLMLNNLVPIFEGIVPRFIMMLLGILIQAIGTYLYLSVELGSGPRDGLMVALVKRTKKSVRFIKSVQDIIVVLVGYILGGQLGIGTVVMAFLFGYFMQFVFRIAKFDVNAIQHRFIDDDIKYIKDKLAEKKQN